MSVVKVIEDRECRKSKFVDLAPGDIFEFEGFIYMKISNVFDGSYNSIVLRSRDADYSNGDLSYGVRRFVAPDAEVTVLDAEIKIIRRDTK